MKKVIALFMAIGLSCSALYAATGTVKQVKQYSNGKTSVIFTKSTGDTPEVDLAGDAEAVKKLIAVVLSAQAAGYECNFTAKEIGGVWGWAEIGCYQPQP